MLSQGIAAKAVRDVWLAAPRSIATHMLIRSGSRSIPLRASRSKDLEGGRRARFRPAAGPYHPVRYRRHASHLISREMKAARRWVPWICSYTGARVNEITSLLASDIQQIMGHWCFVLRPEITKAKRLRRVPIHKHLIEQGFLEYVEERRKLGNPSYTSRPAPVAARVPTRNGRRLPTGWANGCATR